MIFWVVNLLILFLYATVLKNRNSKILFLIIATVHLALISSLRNVRVGTDTFYYAKAYSYLANHAGLYWHAMSNSKIFVIYLRSCAKLIPSINGYVFVTSLPFLAIVSFFIFRYSKNYYISFYLFIFLYFYFNSLNTARQYLSMSLILLFFYFIDERKYFAAFIAGALAIGIHSSALPCIIVCIIVSLIKWTPRLTLAIMVSIHCLSFIVPALVNVFVRFIPQYVWIKKYIYSANYISRGRSSIVYSFYGELALIIGIYWLFWMKRKVRVIALGEEVTLSYELDNHMLQVLQRMMVIVSAASMIYVFYSKVVLFNRMASILYFFIIVLLANVLEGFWGKYRVFKYLLLIPLILFTYYQLRQGIAGVTDYHAFITVMK